MIKPHLNIALRCYFIKICNKIIEFLEAFGLQPQSFTTYCCMTPGMCKTVCVSDTCAVAFTLSQQFIHLIHAVTPFLRNNMPRMCMVRGREKERDGTILKSCSYNCQ